MSVAPGQDRPLLEGEEGALPRSLRLVAVDRLDAHPRAAQGPLHAVGAVPRPREHEGVLDLVAFEERFQQIRLDAFST